MLIMSLFFWGVASLPHFNHLTSSNATPQCIGILLTFFYNPGQVTLWCIEVGQVVNARDGSTEAHNFSRVTRLLHVEGRVWAHLHKTLQVAMVKTLMKWSLTETYLTKLRELLKRLMYISRHNSQNQVKQIVSFGRSIFGNQFQIRIPFCVKCNFRVNANMTIYNLQANYCLLELPLERKAFASFTAYRQITFYQSKQT